MTIMVKVPPKISIILPVYNGEEFLEKSIKSVLDQTYRDFELLLVNDGSFDNSAEICNEYAIIDKRVRVFHRINQGVSISRKIGWKNARGKYLSFIDADDLLDKNALMTLIKYTEQNDFDIINASFEGFPIKRTIIHKKLGVLHNEEYLKSFLKHETVGVVYCSLYKKSLFTEKTFSVGNSFSIGEDVLMNIELASRSNMAINIDDIVYYYRNNPNSVMNRNVVSPSYTERYFEAIESIYKQSGLISLKELEKFKIEKFINILNSFFSPENPMAQTKYRNLKDKLKRFNNIDNIDNWKTKLYLIAIKNGYLTTVSLKYFIKISNLVKNLASKNSNMKRRIIN